MSHQLTNSCSLPTPSPTPTLLQISPSHTLTNSLTISYPHHLLYPHPLSQIYTLTHTIISLTHSLIPSSHSPTLALIHSLIMFFFIFQLTLADLAFLNHSEFALFVTPLDFSKFPKLQALVKRVEAIPKIAAWIKERPVTEM